MPLTARLANRGARGGRAGAVLGIDYHHRLSVAEAASFCQRHALGHARLPRRSRSVPRRPEAYEALRRLIDVPFAIGEEILQQVGFPAVHRAGHHQLRAHRRVQRRRADRGDEGRGLGRGALHRPDAAQSARADLHRGDGAPRCGGAQPLLAGGTRHADRATSVSTTRTWFPAQLRWRAAAIGCRRTWPGGRVQ